MALSDGAFLPLWLFSASAGIFKPDGFAKTEDFLDFQYISIVLHRYQTWILKDMNIKYSEYL